MSMTQGFKKSWIYFGVAMGWLLLLLWPLLGISSTELSFATTFTVWSKIVVAAGIILIFYQLKKGGFLNSALNPLADARDGIRGVCAAIPQVVWIGIVIAICFLLPFVAGRYVLDVAINVMVYICLGLGLNIVVGLAGLLDLGYIAFYGVGAYTYALLSVHYHLSFWFALPIAAFFAAIAGCIIGYPTLRMRGDYLAIVTLGFGEIVRLVLNNWMELTNGPNGILGIKSPGLYYPSFAEGLSLEHLWLNKLHYLYWIVFVLAILTVVGVHRLNFSRIGRAWEAIREDETAAQLMGVNTFLLKLLAYAMGAVFGGLAGAFFAARMQFVSPESFTFIESAIVLSMVVLGGMGSIPGVILGALVLVALPEVFRGFELYRMLVVGGAMVVMMNFRPEGFLPAKRMGARSEERDL